MYPAIGIFYTFLFIHFQIKQLVKIPINHFRNLIKFFILN